MRGGDVRNVVWDWAREYARLPVISTPDGAIVTLEDILAILPPEVVRYLFVRTDPNKHKDFDWAKLPQLVDEYERVERIYYGEEEPSPREDPEELRRIYELSQVEDRPAPTLHQVPFSHLVTLVQVAPDLEGVLAILRRTGELPEALDARSRRALEGKAERARNWVERYATEDQRFSVTEAVRPEALAMLEEDQRGYLASLSAALEEVPWEGQAIHDAVHGLGKELGLKARDAFGAVYIALLGRRRGPRLGYFLASMDRDWVLDRLAKAAVRKE